MAGTFIINELSEWLPASWVFDNAMEDLLQSVEVEATQLATELRDARETRYCDVRRMDAAMFKRLAVAAQEAVMIVRERGTESFADRTCLAPLSRYEAC